MLRGRDTALWRAWFVTVTVAECLGFVVPAVTGVATADLPAAVTVPALVAAGLVEGAALGAAQAHVLRRAVPRLPARRFTVATAVAAALAYALAMVPVALGEARPDLAWPVIGVAGVLCGAAVLASIGTAQWLVLRRLIPHSASWIATTAGAWVVGLGAFLVVATPLWQPGQPLWLAVAIGVAGGLAMAAAVAALTGLALIRLLGRTAARSSG